MSGPLPIELILKPYVQKRSVRTLFLLLSSPIREISSSIKKCLPLNKLINQQEGILAYKVSNGTYLLNDFLNHGDVGHQIQLRNGGDLRISQLFVRYREIKTWNSLSGDLRSSSSLCTFKNYNSCICLSHSFLIYVVSMIIKLLPSSAEVTMQCS